MVAIDVAAIIRLPSGANWKITPSAFACDRRPAGLAALQEILKISMIDTFDLSPIVVTLVRRSRRPMKLKVMKPALDGSG
jgi:hypothetical protein